MSEEHATPTVWHNGVAPELLGTIQATGWDKLEPADAAKAAAKSYAELRAHMGVPTERLLKLPGKPANEAPDEWKSVWQKLGAPEAPEGYEFKQADGTPVDPERAAVLRQSAAELGLPKDMAERFVSSMMKADAGVAEAAAKATADQDALNQLAEQAKLDGMWGTAKAYNLALAQEYAAKSGVKPEEIDAISKVLGYARTMEFFRANGAKTGEADFVQGVQHASGTMTVEMAKKEMADLAKDRDWMKRFQAGGVAEKLKFTQLTTFIHNAGAM